MFPWWKRERVRKLPHFFSYFGGKYREAKSYPKPKYKPIIEPFAGSAGYSSYWADHDVILYDLSPVICGVWEFLIGASEKDVMAIPGKVKHVDELEGFSQEVKWLVGLWLNPASATAHLQSSSWGDQRPENIWNPVIQRKIARNVQYIKHWKIFNKSYEDIPNQKATWHIDPPYIVAGKAYPQKVKDYGHLGEWCKEREGQVMVCEAAGAEWLPFQKFKTFQSNAGPKGKGKSYEVIYVQDQ